MIDPITGSLIFKGAAGAYQLIKGALKNVKRPTYKIPGEIGEVTNNARTGANLSYRPGRDIAVDQINANAASSLDAAKNVTGSTSGLLGTLSRVSAMKNQALQGQDQLDLQYKNAATQRLDRALGTQAGYRDKAWNWNQKQKFEEDAATKSALLEGGLQNIAGSADDYAYMKTLQGQGQNTGTQKGGLASLMNLLGKSKRSKATSGGAGLNPGMVY